MSQAHERQTGNPEEATPAQAAELFKVVDALTSTKGTNYGDRNTFRGNLEATPASVARHFSVIQPDGWSIEQSFYLTHILNRETGVIAIASFDQLEHRDANVILAAHVNYHVISDDGKTYRLERHTTNTEHGPRMVGRDINKSPEQLLNELLELKARAEASRPIEEASGKLTVDIQEATEIINLLTDI